MSYKVSVVVEKDTGHYVWCPELRGCRSQGDSFEEAMTNIHEAVELYICTLTEEERESLAVSN